MTEGGKCREHTFDVHGLLIAQPCRDNLKNGVDETKISIGNVKELYRRRRKVRGHA